MRFFDTEGPVRPDDHYAIPPLEKCGAEEGHLVVIDRRSEARRRGDGEGMEAGHVLKAGRLEAGAGRTGAKWSSGCCSGFGQLGRRDPMRPRAAAIPPPTA